jgi:TRAP transporter TAXI family solute receptor
MKHLLTAAALILATFMSSGTSAQSSIEQRELVNANTVTLMGGSVTGTYIQFASNLSTVFDDGYDLRVLPVVGKGSLKNLEDLLYLRGVDAAIMQSDVLDFVKKLDVYANLDDLISYITVLYNEEVHVVAKNDIDSIYDLRNKKVGFGPTTSGTFMTASTVFDALDIVVDAVPGPYDVALQDLKDGKLDAIVRVAGAPVSYLEKVEWQSGLNLIEIPKIPGSYLVAELDYAAYPGLIPEGASIKTVAVGAVMAAYNWPEDHPRRPKVEKLIRRLQQDLPNLQREPFHPKWKLVDLETELPGWNRFELSEAARQQVTTN